MSEFARAPLTPQHGRLTTSRGRLNGLSSLEVLERGFALFRSTFGSEAWRYYAGAAPLVSAFIPMLVVNGQIRLSNGALLLEATLLAGTYLLRAWMVSNYMQRVRERAFGTPAPKPAGAIGRAAALSHLPAWKGTPNVGAPAALPTMLGFAGPSRPKQFAHLEGRADCYERDTLRGSIRM